jgi:hypothetical protein
VTDQPEPRAIDEYSYPWAQTIDSADGGRTIRIPWLDVDGIETGSVWVFRKDAPVLAAMLTGAARTTPDNPAASNNEAPAICELPHQTIAEEDDCERRRAVPMRAHIALAEQAGKDQAAIARIIDLAEQWTAAGPPPLGTPMARWWDRRLAELHAALDGPADTTPPAEDPSDAPRCPRCGDSLADYLDDDLVYRVGDQRPYCSGECVVRAHRGALKEQPADTCRPVQAGGETIRIHGSRSLTGLEMGYAAQIVAAARRKLAAEPPVVRADDGTESALTRRIRAQQRGLILPAVEPPDDSEPPVPCPACTRARSRGFTIDALAHPGCADALATQEAGR